MPSLKKEYPYSEGWIHAKLTLVKGHKLTPGKLADQMEFDGTHEVAYCEVRGNKAVVVSRKKPAPSES